MVTKTASAIGLAIFIVSILTIKVCAQVGVEKARLARTMWSAFECAAYAELSGNKKEQAKLFEVGLHAGREFIDALKNRQISPEAVSKEAPIGVTMLLAGPSADFVIGRVFEKAMQEAFDNIVKRKNGILLDSSKWIDDEALRKSKAERYYLSRNCTLLK